jgi:hypothetical protein
MKRFWLLALALAGCGGKPATMPDLAMGADMASPVGPDLSGFGSDLAPPSPDMVFAPPTGLSLIAGQLGGFGNADGTGTDARFNEPKAITSDGAGTLYIADAGNNTIRKLVMATGVVTTIAGSAGLKGSTDGMGAAARFSAPYGIVADGAGNLFISDSGNDTIRKLVLATGQVSTIAGAVGVTGTTDNTTGTSARFNFPTAITSDGTNLYVTDTNNHAVRQIVIASAAVSTIAGTAGTPGSMDGTGTAAQFHSPAGIVADGFGNLYVSDTYNGTIRWMTLSTGKVSTVAGMVGTTGSADNATGLSATFYHPAGLAFDGSSALYIADYNNLTVRKMVTTTAAWPVSTVAGTAGMVGSADGTGTAARFWGPVAIVMNGGNVFILDDSNANVRKLVPSSGAVTTVAGLAQHYGGTDGTGAAAQFYNPGAIASDGAGNLLVADSYNHTIRQVGLGSGEVTTLAGKAGSSGSVDGTGAAARFNDPQAVVSDGAGNVYVADDGNHTIRKLVVATGAVTTIAGAAGMMGHVDDTGTAARFNHPQSLALDAAGHLYIGEYGNADIRAMVLATGAVSTIALPAGQLQYPWGLALDGGNLYIADGGKNAIFQWAFATSALTVLAGTPGTIGYQNGTGGAAQFNWLQGLTADGAGNLYVADHYNFAIRKIAIASGAVTTPAGVAGQEKVVLGPLPAGLNMPSGVAVVNGALIISDATENAILVAR